MTTLKPPKTDNVPVNIIVVITTCNQQLKQLFEERELVKAKGIED
jgi:hypothetical protein